MGLISIHNDERFLRLHDVEEMTGLKRSQIYELMPRGAFPMRVKLGGASRWACTEVQRWMQEKMDSRETT